MPTKHCRSLPSTVLLLLSMAAPAIAAGPIRALLITGGCCHDYDFQAKALQDAPLSKGRILWTVVNEGGTGTRGQIRLYDRAAWGDGYDVVVHNECFADTDDEAYIRRIVQVHHDGVPAVVIHCAMHSYRAAKVDDWREFLGVTSRRHEAQGKYAVRRIEPAHPIVAKLPGTWTAPPDELYVIEKLWPEAKALAVSRRDASSPEHPVFLINSYGKARVFGTTLGHSKETFSDPVFLETVLRGLYWACGRIEEIEEIVEIDGAPGAAAAAADWASSVRLPEGEKSVALFNGKDLTGWEGQTTRYWSVDGGAIRGANDERVPASTYLFTQKSYRDFRLLLEVRQTRSARHSTMHSAVAVLGEKMTDAGDAFGFRGPLLMFCNDWGIWDAHRRNRICPAGHNGTWTPPGVERTGDWNQIEVLVRGDRIRMVSNGKLVFDFTDAAGMLRNAPIALQLHGNDAPQEYRFRGLVLVEDPTDKLATLAQ